LADNTVLSAAVGTGDTLQTDDLGSYKIAASKITLGANNSDDGYVSGANPLPVKASGLAAAGAAASGNPVLIAGSDGTNVRTLAVDSGGTTATRLFLHSGTTALVGGAGAVASGVLRVTLASDDPAVASLATLDNIVLLEDAAHASGDPGVQILSVRKDTAAALAGLDADYQPLITDSSGRLHCTVGNTVTVTGTVTANAGTGTLTVTGAGGTFPVTDSGGSLTVDNGGTFACQIDGSALTALQLIDDVVFAEDAGHTTADKGVFALAVRRDAAAVGSGTDGDYSSLNVDANGRLYVACDTHAVTQSGTWNVGTVTAVTSVTNTVTVTGAGGTFPVTDSGGSLTVDNGGTFAVQATVAAGATNIAKAEDVASAGDDVGVPAMAVRKATPANTSGTDGDYEMLQMSAGRLWVDPSGVTLTVASHAVTNAGTFAVQVDGSALTALQLIDDVVFTDDAAFTPGTSKVAAIGLQADETATDSVNEGDVGCPRMTLDRKQIVNPQPHSAGGLTIHRSLDLDEGDLEVVKITAGCVYGMWVTNRATSTRYVKFYDATSGTVGTGTPLLTVAVPGNSSDDITGVFNVGGMGIGFTTGICVGASTGFADNDVGAPDANDVIANIFFS
jgi:hypothetical protein